MNTREIKFKALAPILKGKHKGQLVWWESVFTDGQTVLIETLFSGLKELKEVKAICQFTGYKDTNGKEIYEGDLILVKDKESPAIVPVNIYVVKWCDGFGEWLAEAGDDFALSLADLVSKEETVKIVVGNVYENPNISNLKTK